MLVRLMTRAFAEAAKQASPERPSNALTASATGHPRLRREFDHDVDVAFQGHCRPRRRAEQGGMQGGLEFPQSGKNLIAAHRTGI